MKPGAARVIQSHETGVVQLPRGDFPLSPSQDLKVTKRERELWKSEAKKAQHLNSSDTLQFAAYVRLAAKVADGESLGSRYLAQFNALCRRLRIGTYQCTVEQKAKKAKSITIRERIEISDVMVTAFSHADWVSFWRLGFGPWGPCPLPSDVLPAFGIDPSRSFEEHYWRDDPVRRKAFYFCCHLLPALQRECEARGLPQPKPVR